MNIEEARRAVETLDSGEQGEAYHSAYWCLHSFIDEVEQLIKTNSIKQTPALFKPFEEKK